MTIKETQNYAEQLAASVGDNRRIFALVGDLGAGKTTFAQFFLRALGVTEPVTSPTFVIMKSYGLRNLKANEAKSYNLAYHIDCYRLKSPAELLALGFAEIAADRKNIVLVEWADRVRDILPPDAVWIDFVHIGETERHISILKS